MMNKEGRRGHPFYIEADIAGTIKILKYVG